MQALVRSPAEAGRGGGRVSDLAALIRSHPFFAGFPDDLLPILAGDAMEVEFAGGEIVFREGEPANRFYVILAGRVLLESTSLGGAPVRVQEIGPGEVLGWSWLFPPYVWVHAARAVEPTRAVFFYGTRLREQCEENPRLGYEVMRRMAQVVVQRLQATRRRLREMRTTG